MKIERAIIIKTENYEEEQNILSKFPKSFFVTTSEGTWFIIHQDDEYKVNEMIFLKS